MLINILCIAYFVVPFVILFGVVTYFLIRSALTNLRTARSMGRGKMVSIGKVREGVVSVKAG